jgi:hypothetical protein
VRLLKTVWVVGLALMWLPITAHCTLEMIPAFAAILACCDHEETSAPHQDNDCEQDGCASVESGNYRTQDHDALVVVPNFTLICLPESLMELSALPDEVSLGLFATAPPEQRHIWNFTLRTALPVRAPSLAS